MLIARRVINTLEMSGFLWLLCFVIGIMYLGDSFCLDRTVCGRLVLELLILLGGFNVSNNRIRAINIRE